MGRALRADLAAGAPSRARPAHRTRVSGNAPPDLRAAAEALAAEGATAIRVVPLFFGRGGHLRESVPRLIAATAQAIPGTTFELAEPAGEDEAVIDAIASYCLRAIDAQPG